MPKVKKIPQRQCVGCREMKDKKSLLGVLEGDESGRCLPKQALFKFIGKDVDCSAETLHHSFASL